MNFEKYLGKYIQLVDGTKLYSSSNLFYDHYLCIKQSIYERLADNICLLLL